MLFSERPFLDNSGSVLLPFCCIAVVGSISIVSIGLEDPAEDEWPFICMWERKGRPECPFASAGEALMLEQLALDDASR